MLACSRAQVLTDAGKVGNDKMALYTMWAPELSVGAALPPKALSGHEHDSSFRQEGSCCRINEASIAVSAGCGNSQGDMSHVWVSVD